jgi:mannose-1-phosphate guanylyltransferase / mannose-6-phosphate isomerase
MIQPVILCGGAGTRLWPLSRKSFPKQFVPLIGDKSLLRLTIERVLPLAAAAAYGPVCVGAEEHRFFISETLEAVSPRGSALLEPTPKNTAAAMALAALHSADSERLLLFCPSDHHIPDAQAFAEMVQAGVPAARDGAIVTFGVSPTFPSTAYGYIERGAALGTAGFSVQRFVEKPDLQRAQQMVLSGTFSWNAGIFLCTAGALLTALQRHAPDVLASCQEAMRTSAVDGMFVRPDPNAFAGCRSVSIDYAVMEHHDRLAMLTFKGAWSDVGSWNAVADLAPGDEQGNRISGKAIALAATNTYINSPHRQVVALGTNDLLIIDTPDALLVAARSAAEQVKDAVAKLESTKHPEAAAHRKVARPWGWYDTVENGERFQVKRISVKPGAALSLQKHYQRAEHWIVVKGTAEVTKGDECFLLSENESTYIPIGEVHRLRNPGKTLLEMIEVQSGSYLGEDDIVRFEDSYGRVVVPIIRTRKPTAAERAASAKSRTRRNGRTEPHGAVKRP